MNPITAVTSPNFHNNNSADHHRQPQECNARQGGGRATVHTGMAGMATAPVLEVHGAISTNNAPNILALHVLYAPLEWGGPHLGLRQPAVQPWSP